MQTREQQYANSVYVNVKKMLEEKNRGEYKNMTENLPALIRSAGLVQALHFADSRKDGEAGRTLVRHLAETIGEPELLTKSREASISRYIHLTEKALTALQWYKRLAKAMIEDKNISQNTTPTENQNDDDKT